MTRKEQIKILNDKTKSNDNQYKIDRLNVEISAFSSGDLNKYEFLSRKDLKYKPNALDKAKFEFSILSKAFSTGLDKIAVGYQEEGVIKLLKDIRDGLAGNVNRPNNRPNDNNDDDRPDDRPDRPDDGPDDGLDRPDRPDAGPDDGPDDGPDERPDDGLDRPDRPDDRDDNADLPDLETEEEAADFYEQKKDDKIKNLKDKIKKLKDRILYLEIKLRDNKLSIDKKDKLYKELQNNNDKLEDFIKLYDRSNKFKDDMKDIVNKLSKANDILDILDIG